MSLSAYERLSTFRNKSKEAVIRPSDDDEIDPSDNCCLPPLMEDVIRLSLGYLIGAALTPSVTDIIKVCFNRRPLELKLHFDLPPSTPPGA